MVSIDGWEGKNNGFRFVSEHEHFDPAAVDVPYLEFQQDEKTDREPLQLNTSVFDNLTKADRFSYVLNDFGHAYLTGNLIAVPELDERTIRQHEFWYETVRTFFDAYVRGDPTAAGTIRRADKKHDPSFFARAEFKKGNIIETHR